MRSISKAKMRAEMFSAMSGTNAVSVEWALKNILQLTKEEFRKYKIKNIFGG